MKRKAQLSENDCSPRKKPNIVGTLGILQERSNNTIDTFFKPKQVKPVKEQTPKAPPASSISAAVLKSLGVQSGVGEPLLDILPHEFWGSADNIACFAMFLHERQSITVKRILCPDLEPPFTANTVIDQFFFTNVNRELDTGTKYLKSQLRQYENINECVFAEVLFKIAVYRSVNRKTTFVTFGGIPTTEEWIKFRALIVKMMNAGSKPFTSAHQVQGLDKLTEMVGHLIKRRENIARRLTIARSLEECCKVLLEVPHLGNFLSWQIICDILEIGALSHAMNFVILGPGANLGIALVLNNEAKKEAMKSTKFLTRVIPDVFQRLKIPYQQFLGKPLDVKATEHSLCEFHKYCGAAIKGRSKRRYRPSPKLGNGDWGLKCCLCDKFQPEYQVDNVWPVCGRCFMIEERKQGNDLNITSFSTPDMKETRIRKVKIVLNKVNQ